MLNTKTSKKILAVMLTFAMLASLFAVMGAGSAVAQTEAQPEKFVADFSELTEIAVAGGVSFAADNTYRPGYTKSTDTQTVDGKINAWMAERFSIYNSHMYAKHAWMGQSSASIRTAADTYSGDLYWKVGSDAENGKYAGIRNQVPQTSGGNWQFLRVVETMTVKNRGEEAKLKNFEATLRFSRTQVVGNTNGNAIVFTFHEDVPGRFKSNAGALANTIVIGNSAKDTRFTSDGIAYNLKTKWVPNDRLSYDGDAALKATAFANGLTLHNVYALTVTAKNGTMTVSLVDETTNETVYSNSSTYATSGGYVSFGVSAAQYTIRSLEITELDDAGNAVDFGTYDDTVKGNVAHVQQFRANFTGLPDVNYDQATAGADGYYYYSLDPAVASGFNADGTHLTTKVQNQYTIQGNVVGAESALTDYLESKFDFFASRGAYVSETPNAVGAITSGVPETGAELAAPLSANRWVLNRNKWLGYAYTNDYQDSMYRRSFSMRLQAEDGTAARLENFKLDMDFILLPDTYNDCSNLSVKFRANDPICAGMGDGALFALSPNGGYFFGNDYTVTNGAQYIPARKDGNYTGNALYNTYTGSMNFASSNNKTQAVYEGAVPALGTGLANIYHLALEVKGNAAKVLVTKAGTEILALEENIPTGSGELYIGGSNFGAYFANIVVTRWDENGNPVDFDAEEAKDADFAADFAGIVESRNGVGYRKDNVKKANYFSATGTATEKAWLTNVNGFFTDTANATDKEINDYLNAKFDFYTSINAAGKYQVAMTNPFDGGDANIKWKLSGKYLTADVTDGSNKFCWEMFKRTVSAVAKDANGNQINAQNFTLTADVKLYTGANAHLGGVAIAFRDKTPGKWVAGNNWVQNDAKAFVLLNTKGVWLTDPATHQAIENGTHPEKTATYKQIYASPCETTGNATYCNLIEPWQNGAESLSEVRVQLVANNDVVTLKVLSQDEQTVYFEKQMTTTWVNAGAITFAAIGATGGGFANVDIDVQDPTLTVDAALANGTVQVEKLLSVSNGNWEYLVEVNADDGYELAANSLIAQYADNTKVYPVRNGYRDGMESNQFVFTVREEAVLTANFIQPTTVNYAPLGTSYNKDLAAFRFVHRAYIGRDSGGEFIMVNGTRTAVEEYGLMIALEEVVSNPALSDSAELTLDNNCPYIKTFSNKDSSFRYYDYSEAYIDVSAMILNIPEEYQDKVVLCRMYVKYGDTTWYSDTWECSYAEATA